MHVLDLFDMILISLYNMHFSYFTSKGCDAYVLIKMSFQI